MNEARSSYKLSYVVATRNKLPFLEVTLPRLLEALGGDEEAIIVDGASDDGTSSYLAAIAAGNPQVTVICEPDIGEAHALNKGLLLARGALIKAVSDDDVFSFPAIRDCREYMETHPDVEVTVGNLAVCNLEDPTDMRIVWEYEEEFRAWRCGQRPRFYFNGLPMMLRRDALPLLGLFRTDITAVDLEFSLRVTSRVNLAWYSGVLLAHIENAACNTRVMRARCAEEEKRLSAYYSWQLTGSPGARSAAPQGVAMGLRSSVRLRTRLRATRIWRLLVRPSGGVASSHIPDHRQPKQAAPGLGGEPEQAAETCDSMLATWYGGLPAGFIRPRKDGAQPRPRVAVIPDPFDLAASSSTGRAGLRLIGDALECAGYDVLTAPRQTDQPDLDWLRASCPDVVHIACLSGVGVAHSGANRKAWFTRVTGTRHQSAVERWLAGVESAGVPIVWQVDGTCPLGRSEATREELDTDKCRRLFGLANALVFHEQSSARVVFEHLGQTKKYAVAPLGDSAVLFGSPRDKHECRRRLGLPYEERILLKVPSVAGTESLLPVMDAVRATGPNRALVVVADLGMGGYTPPLDGPLVREYACVSDRMLRDLMCAADFVVENERFLTSGILRMAMSYSTPVLAYRYGSASDMCGGAAVFIEDCGGLKGAVALALDLAGAEYDSMVQQATARNGERSWNTAAARTASLYADLLK